MTEIKSEKITINNSDKNIFAFLTDFNNFGKIMPEQVINWQSTTDRCSFSIKGMADLKLLMDQANEYSFISYKSEDNKPFIFTLNSHISRIENQQSAVQLVFNADLSPMLKMMALKPLKKFVNLLINKLKEVMEE